MKIVNWIKRKRQENLYKKHPCLIIENSINYLHTYLIRLYNIDPDKFFNIMDMLNIKHFNVSSMRTISLFIGDGKWHQKISLHYPKCWDEEVK